MSDDLRYYFFDDEADDHPSIPAEEGWQQMQQLLDAELPLSSKRQPHRYLFFITSVLTAIILLTTALPLKNDFEQHSKLSVSKNDFASETKKKMVTAQIENHNKNINTANPAALPNSITPFTEKELVSKEFNDAVIGFHNSDTPGEVLITEHSDIKIHNNASLPDALNTYDTTNNIAIKKDNKKEEFASINNQPKKSVKNIDKAWH
jgi:hypothetical protein